MDEKLEIRTSFQWSSLGSRSLQEDAVVVSEKSRFFFVADGFGPWIDGNAPAQVALENAATYLAKGVFDEDATLPFVLRSYYSLGSNVLFNAIVHANNKLGIFNKNKLWKDRAGCSLVGGLFDQNTLSVASIGVCSAWLLRAGELKEIVSPKGYFRLLDPVKKQNQDIPLTALGIDADVEPEITEVRLLPGDWVFLASDGLNSRFEQVFLAAFERGVFDYKDLELFLQSQQFSDNATIVGFSV